MSPAMGGYFSAQQFLCQQATLPANAANVSLSFYYLIATAETSTNANDNLFVRIYNAAGTSVIQEISRFSNANSTSTWRNSTSTLTGLAGSSFIVCFDVTTNATLNTNFFLDDVTLSYTALVLPPVAVVPFIPPVAAAGTAQILLDTSFEAASSAWIAANADIIATPPTGAGHTGTKVAWLGGAVNVNEYVCQAASVPANSSNPQLSFYYLIGTQETAAANDNLFVRIYDSTGATIISELGKYSNLNASTDWIKASLNVTNLAGKSFLVCFDATTNGSLNTNFFIDDVTLTYAIPLQPIVIVAPTATNSAPVNRYRINIPSTGGHLYTTDENEYKQLTTNAPTIYLPEGIDHKIFKAAVVSGGQTAIPFFRLYINSVRQHFWTSDRNEYLTLRENRDVFSDDGIDGYLFPNAGAPGSVPLYRLVLNNTAIHHWTTDANEFNFLRVRGWTAEGAPNNPLGVTGYVMPK